MESLVLSRVPAGDISAVLPAYNEEAALAQTVAALRSVLERTGRSFEIIIVNDGSTDGTGTLADTLARNDSMVRPVHHPRNLGYGAALRSGFAAARCEWIFLMDADGQFDPGELPGFLEAARDADFVVGYRPTRADPGHRVLFAKVWAALMSLALGVRVRDVDCAFKVMRRSYIAAMTLEAGGAFLSAELLAKARRSGARIVERPVRHLPRRAGRQTGSSLRVLVRAFYEFSRLWWRVRRSRPATPAR
ncbi:MAG: glycosyltransferase family 2 protein [Armatimonadota bacterium]